MSEEDFHKRRRVSIHYDRIESIGIGIWGVTIGKDTYIVPKDACTIYTSTQTMIVPKSVADAILK